MPSRSAKFKRRWQRDSEDRDPDPDKNKEAIWETWEWSDEAQALIRYRVFSDKQVQKALHVDWSKVNTKGRDERGVEVTPKHLMRNIMELFPGVKASCRKRRQGKNTAWRYAAWLRSLKGRLALFSISGPETATFAVDKAMALVVDYAESVRTLQEDMEALGVGRPRETNWSPEVHEMAHPLRRVEQLEPDSGAELGSEIQSQAESTTVPDSAAQLESESEDDSMDAIELGFSTADVNEDSVTDEAPVQLKPGPFAGGAVAHWQARYNSQGIIVGWEPSARGSSAAGGGADPPDLGPQPKAREVIPFKACPAPKPAAITSKASPSAPAPKPAAITSKASPSAPAPKPAATTSKASPSAPAPKPAATIGSSGSAASRASDAAAVGVCASPRGGAGGSAAAAPSRAASSRSSSSGSSSSSHKIELIRIYSNPRRAPARPESSSTGGASSSWRLSAAAAVGVAPPQPRVPQPLEQNRGLRALAEVEQDRTGLIQQWIELARGRKKKPIPTFPYTAHDDFGRLFQAWLHMRGLDEKVIEDDNHELVTVPVLDPRRWRFYKLEHPAQAKASEAAAKDARWSFAWHGTWWYALWSILEAGRMLESNDASKGHDFLQGRPGVPALLQ